MDPVHPAGSQMADRLAVKEKDDAFLVVREEEPDDWLARFDKGDGFPAQSWAENMVRVFNGRLSGRLCGPPSRPGTRPDGYGPDATR